MNRSTVITGASMTNEEIMEWSHSIADACLKTTIKPKDVEAACMAYVEEQKGIHTRHAEHFGTPERAARTLIRINNGRFFACPMCIFDGIKCCGCSGDEDGSCEDALSEWLKGEYIERKES